MAGAAQATHLHAQNHRILVAIDAQFHHLLGQAAGRTLVPQFLAAAAPVDCLAEPYGLLQGLLVHEGDHQHIAGLVIHRHRRHQAVLIELGGQLKPFFQLFFASARRECDFHRFPGFPRLKPYLITPGRRAPTRQTGQCQ